MESGASGVAVRRKHSRPFFFRSCFRFLAMPFIHGLLSLCRISGDTDFDSGPGEALLRWGNRLPSRLQIQVRNQTGYIED